MLRLGKHIKRHSPINDSRFNDIFPLVDFPVLLQIIETFPIEEVLLVDLIPFRGQENAHGFSINPPGQIFLRASRAPDTYGISLSAKAFSISKYGDSLSQALAYTLTHEIGHCLIHLLHKHGVDDILMRAHSRALQMGKFFTEYASVDRYEYFCENLAVRIKPDLANVSRQTDAIGYDLVDEVVQLALGQSR
jgi:hypothetical protein